MDESLKLILHQSSPSFSQMTLLMIFVMFLKNFIHKSHTDLSNKKVHFVNLQMSFH